VADSLPKRFLSGNSNPDKSKNFLGACLFKSAHSEELVQVPTIVERKEVA
jgi:hypothetical protein